MIGKLARNQGGINIGIVGIDIVPIDEKLCLEDVFVFAFSRQRRRAGKLATARITGEPEEPRCNVVYPFPHLH